MEAKTSEADDGNSFARGCEDNRQEDRLDESIDGVFTQSKETTTTQTCLESTPKGSKAGGKATKYFPPDTDEGYPSPTSEGFRQFLFLNQRSSTKSNKWLVSDCLSPI